MQPVTVVASKPVPLLYSDIDTDQIIPAGYITSRTAEEFARALFAQRRTDPSFVLNQAGIAGRTILLSGRNFGCGSSREQAVWALQAGGFRAVVAPSFGEIFASNALKNGLLAVQTASESHEAIVRAVQRDPELTLEIDLRDCTVSLVGTDLRAEFDIDPFYRSLLLQGMQELDYLLRSEPAIETYEVAAINPVVARRLAAGTGSGPGSR